MKKILFTGGGGAAYEVIFRMWQGHYNLFFADAFADVFSPTLPQERCHVIPLANESDFSESVVKLCRRLEIDLLVPAVDEELSKIENVRAMLPEVSVLLPEHDFIVTMLDKLSTTTSLRARGITMPRTVTIKDITEIGFPCFAKPRWGRGSRGIQVLTNQAMTDAYRLLSGLADDEIVVQELLGGQEYTIMMAADKNKNLHAIVPVKVEVKRGITVRAQTEANQHVLDACRRIHNAWPVAGCYNIQLFLTEDKRILPIEINPRISTTFCLGVASGVDPIKIFFSDKAPQQLLPFKSGMRLQRNWYNHIS